MIGMRQANANLSTRLLSEPKLDLSADLCVDAGREVIHSLSNRAYHAGQMYQALSCNKGK